MDGRAGGHHLSSHVVLLGTAVLSGLAFVWSHRFLPMQDWPDWIVQGSLVADALQHGLAPPYSIKNGPVPNVISSMCIGLLTLVFEPETAGKLVLTGYVIGGAAASFYLLRSARRVVPVGILTASLIVLPCFPFFHGEINYALGLVVLYAGLGFLLRRTDRCDLRALFGVFVVALVIFFCHGACYAIWMMFLAAYAWNARRLRTVIGLAVAVTPSLMLTALYTLSKTAESSDIVHGWSALEIVTGFPKKLWLVFKFLAPLQGFYPFIDERLAWVFVFSNFVALGFALYILTRWKRTGVASDDPRLRVIRNVLVLHGVAFVLAPHSVGGLLNPAERLVLPTFHLLLTAFVLLRPEPAAPVSAVHTRIGLALLALQAVYIHGYGGFVSRQLDSSYAKLHQYAVRPTTVVLHESHFRYQGHVSPPSRPLAWQLLPLHFPMLRLTYYASLEVGLPLPIFETGQFRSVAGRLLNSADAVASARGGGPIVIVGWPPGARTVASLLPERFTLLESDGASFVVVGEKSL